ncbi:MAG TPA: hypothetical protein PKY56_05645 [Candidatus Kapabacteria bacterium]|nr:hypothetical protein [Candidatus Kapabacteria bacterium]HPO61499.1 hypothetical protein [Candidatus Kapabacteria bacterium]
MGLNNNQIQSKTYIKIKAGKFITKSYNQEIEYNSFSGFLRKIELFDGTINFNNNDVKVKIWNVYFEDNGTYIWSVDYNSHLFLDFLNSIYDISDFSEAIEIQPFFHNNRNKINVFYKNNRLKWHYNYDDLPKIEPVIVDGTPIINQNGFQVFDYTKRSAFVEKMVEEILQKIPKNDSLATIKNNYIDNSDISFNPDDFNEVESEEDKIPF